jgi:hypothetical protein
LDEHAQKNGSGRGSISEWKPGSSPAPAKYYDESGKQLTIGDLLNARVLQGEKILNVVIRCERPGLPGAYFNISGSPIYSTDGEIVSAILCLRDVTEKYKHQQEIKEKKGTALRLFGRPSPDALVVSQRWQHFSYELCGKAYYEWYSQFRQH